MTPRLWIEYTSQRRNLGLKKWPNQSKDNFPYILWKTDLKILGVYNREYMVKSFFKDSVVVSNNVLFSPIVYLVVLRYTESDTFGEDSGSFIFYSAQSTIAEAVEDKRYLLSLKKNTKDFSKFYGWGKANHKVELYKFIVNGKRSK